MQGLTLTVKVGTDDTTDEGPDNLALDAEVVGSEKTLTLTWDANTGTLYGIVVYGFDAADVEGSDANTNTETLKELAIYSGGTFIYRHVFPAFAKTSNNRFKVEIPLRLFVRET